MPRFSVAEASLWGCQFVQFLQDTGREQTSLRETLRTIYNQEFRGRTEARTPNFSCMLFALRTTHQVQVRGDLVKFKVKRHVVVADQYRRPRSNAQTSVATSASGQQLSSTPQMPQRYAKQWAELIRGKHGVEITSDYDQGNGNIRFPVVPGEPRTVAVLVQNRGTEVVTLQRFQAQQQARELSFTDEQGAVQGQSLLLHPGGMYPIQARCLTTCNGHFSAVVSFEFTKEPDVSFSISRYVAAIAESQLAKDLGPSAPFQPYEASLQRHVTVITEDGIPPDSSLKNELEREIPLGTYQYPKSLKDTILLGPNTSASSSWAAMRSLLEAPLQAENYYQKFQLLLHLEEIQMEVDIRRYDMQDVTMVQERALLVLDVPGVAENRPSLLRGDHLFAHLSSERDHSPLVRYKGYVHSVELDRVRLGFSSKLQKKFVKNLKFDVTFTFSRLPLQVQHRAVVLAVRPGLSSLLFPSASCHKSLFSGPFQPRWFNRKLETNEEQCKAVTHIVTGVSRPAPYLIFGPPGTGKTVTVVEAIKQVWTCFKDAHILACAPSNSAADLLCQCIIKDIAPQNVYRLIASSRSYREVPTDIRPCCNWDDEQSSYVYPSKERLSHYRIIITTLVTAGRSEELGLSPASVAGGPRAALQPGCGSRPSGTQLGGVGGGQAAAGTSLLCGRMRVKGRRGRMARWGRMLRTASLRLSSRLVSAGFAPGFFSHVFIDECGHAVEPESVVAVAGLLAPMDEENNPSGGQLVLAGDPKQLGPVLTSPLAIQYGLGTSLLERLMLHNPLYQKSSGGYNPQFITKLLWNYRSHEAILRIPNELFYDNELKVCRSNGLDIRNLFCTWEELPKKGFPIIFHGVCGEDQREAKSPSFFNTAEIEVLVHYLKRLLQSRGRGSCPSVSPKEIGIISPYRKQVEKIRKAITCLDPDLQELPDISQLKVGSVEEFQGQERQVILISTVRSCSTYLQFDQTFRLGFLKNPKRLNVAITRAKALLIVVGNPTVLSKDHHWLRFLRYCKEQGGYTGYPFEEEGTAEDRLANDLQALQLRV
ncbi:helicase MOV-10 isoform X1 [Ammospiza nelsoni]|uniref:helicase MOV-10 isoform X1 n=1 Tax=Ammospiza nelsoni TaxID=2857394 RepID=UPI00286B85CF|nr:helicase MOV-10 isoform X1 [Ammospiza nelsoni]XP_059343907.1 helicase MOV-10 isoform X1 [Ammospiza nelsoni]XP_059343908.1 helicase MOV-10 isoform X1 [Ammospiza nelsoni]